MTGTGTRMRAQSVHGPEDRAHCGAISGSALRGTFRRDVLEGDPRALAADARIFAADFAHKQRLGADAADDLVWVVDALVANAIVHPRWPAGLVTIDVTLTRLGDCVIVEVGDQDGDKMPVWPSPESYVDAAFRFLNDPSISADADVLVRKRGLFDVAMRSQTTTAYREGTGKVVRAVLAPAQ